MVARLGLGLGLIPAAARPVPTEAPVNTVLPSITGILTQGQTLTADPGSWSGLPSAAFTYQWQRSGSNIGSATGSTYVAQAADVAAGADAITVEVTGTNDIGPTTAESTGVTIAAPLALSGTPGDATVSSPYSFTPGVTGGHAPYTYALTGTLPDGLSFNTSTGAITGTPSSSGTASGLDITVTDNDGLTDALGTFDILVSSGGIATESREATIALTPAGVTTAGDSLTQGNGTTTAPTDYSWPKQFRDIATGGTLLREEVGGMAWEAAAQGINTDPITLQITGQGATGLSSYTQFWNGSINNYNASVMASAANTKTWEDAIVTNLATAVAALSGHAATAWTFFAGLQSEVQGPGMIRYASWRSLLRRTTALYGARVFDIWRYLQFRGSQDVDTLDYKNVNKWGTLPITYRGMGQSGGNYVLFDDAVLPETWLTGSTATNTSAGIAAVIDPTTVAEGALFQNLNSGVAANSVWRVGLVSSVKTWVQWDNIHLSRWGYEVWGQLAFDIAAALQDDGAPVGCPAELFCAQDAASTAACGTIHYIGSVAPADFTLYDENGVEVTTLTLVDNGVTGNAGTITVTRSATGSLTEGEQKFTLQMEDAAGHVLHSPVDFRVGQPSTQTVPRLWTLPGTTGLPSADFSMQGRTNHGMADGNKFGFALYLEPVDFASDQQYVIHFAAGHGNSTTFQVRISTGGNLNIIANNAAGTLVLNASVSGVFTSGQPTWVAVDIDLDQTTPTIRGYHNKNNAATDTAISASGVTSTGPTTLAMSNCEPRFFSLKDANINNENWAAADATRDQYRGAFGNIIMWNGSIGIDGTPSVARELWLLGGTPGAPTPRAPYSAINGITPIFDIQGGIGDFLRGGFDQDEPVYGTYRGIKGLVAA